MKRYVIKGKELGEGRGQFKIDYRKELNEAQYLAATTLEGPVLVIAGAGSGKTRTLVYRVARLVELGVSPESILLLTFTRRAAQEMLRRASAIIDARCERVSGGTFHSFANTVLRKYASVFGFPSSFTILDRTDSEDVIGLLRSRMGYAGGERRFPKKSTVQEIFSMSTNKVLPLEEVVEGDYPHFINCIPELLALREEYTKYKCENSLMDYDDLLVYLKALLEGCEGIRRKLSDTYKYIMVDEYQDTNKIQAQIVRLLAFTHENVMVVGDDSQSIYSFRGANFRNIMDFPKDFPRAEIIKLEENYRSTQPILDLTNEIIKRAKEKYLKTLYTRKQEGPRPALVVAPDERFQSMFVAQRVLELREEGVPLSDIAVLFRSSYHSFDLEIELNKRNIPYVKYGGFKFIETAHIKDVIAHLRVVFNPQDVVSWNRILLLIEGVGPKTSGEIISKIVSGEIDVHNLERVQSALRYSGDIRSLARVLRAIAGDNLRPADQVNFLLKYYLPILREKYDDHPKREKDLEHLQAISERYRSLESFLTDMALEPPNESVSGLSPTDTDDELLILSTIHSAKGLEWHTVFIIWALEGRFPITYSIKSEEAMDEELRLMYVAATRAKRNLYITYPINVFDRATGLVFSKPSRFIDGMAEEILEQWSLVPQVERIEAEDLSESPFACDGDEGEFDDP
ncbi:MAG: ATP-dependent helicase [bacterium]